MESIGTRLGRLHESIPQDVQTHGYLLRRLKLPAEGSAELCEERRLSVHCGRAAGVLRALWLATDRCPPVTQLLCDWLEASRPHRSRSATSTADALTDGAGDGHGVGLLHGLAAVQQQLDVLSRRQGQKRVAGGGGGVVHPADGAHGALIRRKTRGHRHRGSSVWSDGCLETFWRIRSELKAGKLGQKDLK